MTTHSLEERPSFYTLLLLIILFPTISFADANKIFKENNKAVVVIVTLDNGGNPLMQGSGFIVRADGAIVTNYHVISNAVDIKVKVGDKVLDVEGLLNIDKENDLVILKAVGKNLPTVKLGDIEKATIGEKVYVISSPEGLENTISDGILSGIRDITLEKKVLQITAPISPGSSGGPVFNKNGEVIGIATFIIEEAQNLNFAIPVRHLAELLRKSKDTKMKKLVDSLGLFTQPYESINRKEQEEIYLFALDFILSQKYLLESEVGLLGDKNKVYFITFGVNKLNAAINKMQYWRNNHNVNIRRISEDLVLAIKDLISMQEQVTQLSKMCILASTYELTTACKMAFSDIFSEQKDGNNKESGKFFKLINRFQEISDELLFIITNKGVTKEKNITIEENNVNFILSKRQLKEIYKYLDSFFKIRASLDPSFSLDGEGPFLSKLLICYEFTSKSFPDSCELQDLE